jgi:dienelactone hydrolase
MSCLYKKFLYGWILLLISTQVIANPSVREEVVMIPYDWSWELEVTVLKPEGAGPFPMVVINHGKDGVLARDQNRFRPMRASHEFLKRGYLVVLPMRSGFSKSDGTYKQRGCDLRKDALVQAKSIDVTIQFFSKESYVDASHILLVGYSYGGLVSVAYGSAYQNPSVRGIINFSGGLKNLSGPCVWDVSLLKAFSEFGKTSRIPNLWIYAANDELFPATLATNLAEAYRQSGAPLHSVVIDAYSGEGHRFFDDSRGIRYWVPHVTGFLKEIHFEAGR